MRLVRVAVPVPALDSLTYSLPAEVQPPAIGARVLVPLGNRVLTGCVVEGEDLSGSGSAGAVREPPLSTIKPIIEVLDVEPFLPEEVVRLATWVAEYLRLRHRFGACRCHAPDGRGHRARRRRQRFSDGSRRVVDGAGTGRRG